MKLLPENKFLAAALSVIAVGAVAGYIAVIAPNYDSEDRIPPPPDRVLAAPAEEPAQVYLLEVDPETDVSSETDSPSQTTELSKAETEPAPIVSETVLLENDQPVPEETEPTTPETDPESPETTAPAILILETEQVEEGIPAVSREFTEEIVLFDPEGYYVVNTDSGIIHIPTCYHVDSISPENRSGTDHPDELIAAYPDTYRWCKHCSP